MFDIGPFLKALNDTVKQWESSYLTQWQSAPTSDPVNQFSVQKPIAPIDTNMLFQQSMPTQQAQSPNIGSMSQLPMSPIAQTTFSQPESTPQTGMRNTFGMSANNNMNNVFAPIAVGGELNGG